MRIPSIVILGADALIAALPATPIQFAHACALVGYQHVVPASWGDELIAAATLRALHAHDARPAIQCSCPFVAHRLLAVGTDLRPFLISLVAPPVVLARYLRAMAGETKLRITYVGRCPGAADEAIDARLTPEELLAIFSDHQVVISDQPQVFDSVIPPDRRRYRSQPGGLPTPEILWSANGNGAEPRTLVELQGDDLPVELAQQLLAGRPVLIDVAPKLGCVCSGAANGVNPTDARASVTALEPPRAASTVVDERLSIDASLPLPASPRSAIDVVSPPTHIGGPYTPSSAVPNGPMRPDLEQNDSTGALAAWSDVKTGGTPQPSSPGRRHSPPRGIARAMSGALPTARDADGRQLPRTYVARRRLPARITRNTPAEASPIIAPDSQTSTANPAPNDTSGSVATTSSWPEAASMTDPVPGGLFPSGGDPASWPGGDPGENVTRFSERAVALPVTRLSDSHRRDESQIAGGGDRPLTELTRYLLIAMIVLVSVSVGVLVGRWMSQH